MKSQLRVKAALAGALLLGVPAFSAAAEHHGRVQINGVPVPGVTITATQGSRTMSTVTDTQGVFQFTDLPDGTWTIRVEMRGFETVEGKLSMSPSSPASTWELKLLPMEQMFAIAKPENVTAPVLTPRTAAPSTREKPVDTPDASAAAPPAPMAETDTPRTDGMLINGSESNAATSRYSLSPAFGTRRSGAKALYTGSLGLFASQSVLDAKPYSITGLEVPKAAYSRFTVVATLGGPLRIPHLLRNGPTFFVAYQRTHDSTANTLSGLVPTLQQRVGDLSGTLTSSGAPVSVSDPLTGAALNGPLAVSSQAAALLALYPLPNLADSTRYNYQSQVLSGSHIDAMQSRLDRGFGRRDQIYGGLAFRSERSDSENLFHFRDKTDTLGLEGNAHWAHRFPRQLQLDLGYRLSRLRTLVRPNFQDLTNVSGNAGINGNEQSASDWGPPNLSFSSGIAGLSDLQSAFNRNRTDGVSASAIWTHRRHVVTFGGDFRRQEFNELQQQNPRGTFTFTGTATKGSGTTGSDLADFLLGTPDTSQIAYGNADKYLRQSAADMFIVDDWRLLPELTINTGLRWDYGGSLSELKGRLVNLDIAPGFASASAVLGSSPVGPLTQDHYPSSLVRSDFRMLQPRVALSWRPLPTSSLVVRAGYGVYADTSVYLASTEQMAQQAPLSKSASVARSSTCPITLANGFLNCSATTPQVFAIDPDFRVGYAQTWRLALQQDVPGAIVLTATYLGIKGTRGPQEFLPNTDPIGATAACPRCPRGFVYRTSYGDSIRHAAELQLRRRLRGGLTATLDYVFAHSIDNDAELGGAGRVSTTATATAEDAISTSAVLAQDWRNLRAERSNSSFDQRHRLSATAQYTSGMGLQSGFMQGWRGAVLKDWTVSGQFSYGTGLPQTPIYLAAVPDTGITGSIRGNPTGAPVHVFNNGYHLSAAAFTSPLPGQWGTAGRNSIMGPSSLTLDSSLARIFRLKDPMNVEIRLDATNLLNHVVFTSWTTIVNSTTFGLPAGTQPMRSMQLSGRLRF